MRNSPPDPAARLRAAALQGVRAAAAVLKHPPAVCAAYSGGLDSTVLLQLLAASRADSQFTLSAIHVHHGLSVNADAWTAHCTAACAALEVPLQVVRAEVNRAPRTSLEEEARRVRYAAFAGAAADVIALAHHADDQAETVLLQLLRGAGPKGLAGMPLLKPLSASADRPLLLRPLLEFPRAGLASLAAAQGWSWIEDESNLDNDYKRNFIRNRVSPLLREAFPDPAATLSRAARHQAEAARLLDALADLDLACAALPPAQGADGGDALDAERLKRCDDERMKNALRRWLGLAGLRQPSEARLAALVRAVRASSNDTRLTWEHEGRRLVRRKGVLALETALENRDHGRI